MFGFQKLFMVILVTEDPVGFLFKSKALHFVCLPVAHSTIKGVLTRNFIAAASFACEDIVTQVSTVTGKYSISELQINLSVQKKAQNGYPF